MAPVQREPRPPVIFGFLGYASKNYVDMADFNSGLAVVVNGYGYDFDHLSSDGKGLRLVCADTTSPSNLTEIAAALSIQHHYQIVINLAPANNLTPLAGAKDLELFWGGNAIGAVPVVQQVHPTHHREVAGGANIGPFAPSHASVLVNGEWKSGDSEFNGHGPCIHCTADVFIDSSKTHLRLRLYMEAYECDDEWSAFRSDFTAARGSRDYDIWTAPVGETVISIDTPTRSTLDYIDTNTATDTFNAGLGELVRTWKCVGDTDGSDVGETSITVVLNTIKVTTRE